MDTNIPKPAMMVDGKPMVERIVDSLEAAVVDQIIVVVGYKKEIIMDILKERVTYIEQRELTGTATAVKDVVPYLKDESQVIIFPGDIPYLNKETVSNILENHFLNQNNLTVVSMEVPRPTGFGRIVRKPRIRIVEEVDASVEEKAIREVNTGIIVAQTRVIKENINLITNNNKSGEYYLTDLIEIVSSKAQVGIFLMTDFMPVIGVNDRQTLNNLQKKVKKHWQKDQNVVK